MRLAPYIFLIFLVITSTFVEGCHRKKELILTSKFFKNHSYSSGATSDPFKKIALLAEQRVPEFLHRVHFTPGNKKRITEHLAEPLHQLEIPLAQKTEMTFEPRYPFEHYPYHKGWQILGKAMEWNIQKAVLEKNPEASLFWFLKATRFGFQLLGGGALDAALGLSIADHARRAFLPVLPLLDTHQLGQLKSSLLHLLQTKTPLTKTIENEHQNMLAAVQYIQDAYTQNKLTEIQKNLGPDIKSGLVALHRISNKNHEIIQYFDALTAEANQEAQMMTEDVQKPMAMRQFTNFTFEKNRPWKKISKHFFGTLRPLITLHDRTLAWTRLLALKALILKHIEQTKKTPTDLSSFPLELYEDPFSGKPFVYHADGCDFKLYSVGENLIDDGGQSDVTKFRPDLVLE